MLTFVAIVPPQLSASRLLPVEFAAVPAVANEPASTPKPPPVPVAVEHPSPHSFQPVSKAPELAAEYTTAALSAPCPPINTTRELSTVVVKVAVGV
jgi:hypothetical protein